MAVQMQFFGTAGEVTGSCHLVMVGDRKILLDFGMSQGGLMNWSTNFEGHPPVVLVHGVTPARDILAERLHEQYKAPVQVAYAAASVDLLRCAGLLGSR